LNNILFHLVIAPVSYKSDPMFGCNISLEHESFLERFKCIILRPLQMFYVSYPFLNQLNNLKKMVNVEPRTTNLPKASLSLVDTFFGFEVIIKIDSNLLKLLLLKLFFISSYRNLYHQMYR
jgi:hypothetical protein